LPNSKLPAITATAIAAPLKIAIRPAILKYAAIAAINNAVIKVTIPDAIVLFILLNLLCLT
jgi:hypothetical protein